MIITIAQQKGGAGKTTLTAQLATAFLQMRKTVAVVDIDPQASLTRWAAVRQQILGDDDKLKAVQASGWRATREVENLDKTHHYVFIDSPPHTETDAKLAIRAAHILLIPIQPSPMDIWATKATIDLAKAENVPTLLVPNRVPPRSNMAEGIIENLAQLGSAVSRVHLGSRIAYAESMISGQGVVETHRLSTAADEMSALARDVVRFINQQQRKAA